RLPAASPLAVERREVDADVAHRRSLWCFGGPITFRASVPPTRVSAFVAVASVSAWSADEAFGIVVGDVPPGGAEAVLSAATSVGGSAAVVDGSIAPPRVVATPTNPVERDVIARLKQAFNPNAALAPLPAGLS